MGIILWIVFGAIAGWLASMIMKSKQGIVLDVITGVIGAMIGGFIMTFFGYGGVSGFNLYSLVVAVLGAIVLIALERAVLRA
jgi:uncharacterized membrane protein YeaQ/YmgE (transglycosylase-associated protein family)